MKQKSRHIIRFIFLWIVALQILNTSTNSIDFHPVYSTIEFNDLNSIVEYISEVVLEHTNAFPEFDQKTSNKSQSIKHIDIKIYKPVDHSFYAANQYTTLVEYIFPLDEKYSYLFSKEINPPPPKA